MKRRKVIALMMANAGLRNDYQGLLREGVERACRAHDVDLWSYAGRSDWRPCGPTQGRVYQLVAPDRVDGIVLAAGCIASFLSLEELLSTLNQRCPVPVCAVGYRVAGIPSLTIDNRQGAAQVVEHLVREHRRRRFAYIAGPEGHEESEERLGAARDALQRHGIELSSDAIRYGRFSHESGVAAMRDLLEARLPIDAVVAANDDMAIGALEALTEAGIRCPQDVAVTGFDDAPLSRICHPQLTTVRQPIAKLGAEAGGIIISAWRGEPTTSDQTLHTEGVFRESCGCDPLRLSPGCCPDDAPNSRRVEDLLCQALNNVIDDADQRRSWAERLWRSAESERAGESGSLLGAMRCLLDEASRPDVEFHDLQQLVTRLRELSIGRGTSRALEDSFHRVLSQVGATTHQRDSRRWLHAGMLMEDLRISWERLATSLSLQTLKEVLVQELPRFSVRNAMVSVYAPEDLEALVPLACLVDGVAVDVEPKPFPAVQLMPDGIPASLRRSTFTVMPLTFEWEHLGVAMLELPSGQEVYAVLREQIGSAIKTARLHEQLMLQQERLKRQAELETLATEQRLKSMGVIAGGVAHDLNNALGPLVALPEAIRRDLDKLQIPFPEQVLGDLDTLQQAAQHAAHTIGDLLTLGRATEVPKRTLELGRALRNSQKEFERLAQRAPGVVVRLVPAVQPLVVHVSREHLLRAVSNLVVNAADASGSSGDIIVRLRERLLTQRLEGTEPVEPGHYAVIEVEDFGCGIPEENIPRVLEPFFTSKKQTQRGGTGLGLAIVHQVVKQSHGYVHVRSIVGQGTTFGLYLPLVARASIISSIPPAPPIGGTERILVVDDEPVQLRTASRVLTQLGYTVVTADSGEAALELFEDREPPVAFHLVILDMLLGGSLTGLGTLELLRQRRPGQKAIIVSGYTPERMNTEATRAGVAWLAKPYTPAVLAEAVRSALTRAESEAARPCSAPQQSSCRPPEL